MSTSACATTRSTSCKNIICILTSDRNNDCTIGDTMHHCHFSMQVYRSVLAAWVRLL
jgi:hypothetical protein